MRFSKSKTIILACEDIQKIAQHFGIHKVMDALIDKMMISFKQFDPNKTNIPTRAVFSYDHPDTGLVEWMPFHGPNGNGIKNIIIDKLWIKSNCT